MLAHDKHFILEAAGKAQAGIDLVERFDPFAVPLTEEPQELA